MINKNAGFTLIEILIAMLVLAFGLLGLAALQATSLKNNLSAYNRSQATQLAYDMADRIRANPVNANLLTSVYLMNDVQAQNITNADAVTACENSSGCTPAQMAQNDKVEWLTKIRTLPSGKGTITANINAATNTKVFTITVSWDDNRSGAADTNFTMSFQL